MFESPNFEIRMTKLELNAPKIFLITTDAQRHLSDFGIRHSFVIRVSCFVIPEGLHHAGHSAHAAHSTHAHVVMVVVVVSVFVFLLGFVDHDALGGQQQVGDAGRIL